MSRIILLLAGLMTLYSSFAQSGEKMIFTETDTVPLEPIIFTISSASEYIAGLLEMEDLWSPSGDTIRISLSRLIDHFNEPYDSVEKRLSRFNYDAIKLKHTNIVRNDTLPLKWLNDSTFIMDTMALEREPFILQKTVIRKVIDATAFDYKDHVPNMESMIEPIVHEQDTITEIFIDSVFLASKKIQMHQIINKRIIPPLLLPGTHKSARVLPGSAKIIISDTTKAIVADAESPFFIVPGEKMPDSLRHAVETLISYTVNRDSILLFIHDINGHKTPFWLTTGKDDLYRYWVKNYKNDSITIWMGNPAKNDITLILEEDINVDRIKKETAEYIPITTVKPQKSLAKTELLEEIPVFWDYELSSSFGLNQTYLSNWSKGGESSLSSMLDIKGAAKYTDTKSKKQWTNSGRLKYGTIITEEYGLRTNTDLLEMNSQYNKVIKNKFDFSAVFYMKSQVSKGYNYPNDSVVISKFLNPGTFTIGMGFEYKPSKKTQINFSLLSYKNTFVLDTANIDQTIHGIAKDKRAKQEMGGQLLIKNSLTILNDLKITSSVRLFSGYLNKPENIDVDWEINIDKKIKWYFSILLNIHMIYDDDIRFPVLDKNDQPILLPDGSKKKSPKLQFKEFLGLTFSF